MFKLLPFSQFEINIYIYLGFIFKIRTGIGNFQLSYTRKTLYCILFYWLAITGSLQLRSGVSIVFLIEQLLE
jgi:hypothetical protein